MESNGEQKSRSFCATSLTAACFRMYCRGESCCACLATQPGPLVCVVCVCVCVCETFPESCALLPSVCVHPLLPSDSRQCRS